MPPFSGLDGAARAQVTIPASGRLETQLLAQDLPTTVEPGRIEKQFEEQAVPQATEEPIIPETEDEAAPPEGADTIRFVLNELAIEGVTAYEPDELAPIYQDLIGQEISLATIYRLANQVTARYRGDGFILSRAVVPAQRVRAGKVRLQVIEGFINEVIIDGEIAGRESLLESYARKITESRPLHAATLERYLLLTDDLPGMTAKAVLTPSFDVAGASDMVLFVEHKSLDESYGFDNRGTRFVGPFQASVQYKLNSPFGLYERIGLRGIVATQTEELRFFQVTHDETLGSEGTKFITAFNLTRSRPGFTLQDQDVVSDSQELQFILSHPFIRSRSQNLTARAKFEWTKQQTDTLGALLFEDRLRVVRAGLAYDFVDSWRGVNLVEVEASQGLDVFNASTSGSDMLSREHGKSDFFKVTGDFQRLQALSPGWTLLFGLTGQYSGSQLLSAEEFGVGGAEYGRAYDGSEITGDHGVAGKVEVQWGHILDTFLRFGRESDAPTLMVLKDVQLYLFYDYGVVWRIDAGSGLGSERESLASTGFGIRANLSENISGYVEFAQPLTRDVEARGGNGDDYRVFFAVAARF